jgi:outer membrane immunogenic protein
MQLLKNPLVWLGGLLAAAALFAWNSKASADPWTGCYLGGLANYSALVQDGGGIGVEGPGAAGTVGCDIQRGKLVFGALAEYGFSVFDAGGDDIDLEGWAAGARAGYLVWDNTLLYGVAKWVDVDASTDGSVVELSLTGPSVGAGAEIALGGGFFTRVEYGYAMLEPDETLIADEQVNIHTARVGFVFKFGAADDIPNISASKPLK